jgi:hypothetical protein
MLGRLDLLHSTRIHGLEPSNESKNEDLRLCYSRSFSHVSIFQPNLLPPCLPHLSAREGIDKLSKVHPLQQLYVSHTFQVCPIQPISSTLLPTWPSGLSLKPALESLPPQLQPYVRSSVPSFLALVSWVALPRKDPAPGLHHVPVTFEVEVSRAVARMKRSA